MAFRFVKSVDGLLWVAAILGLAGSRRPPKDPGRAAAGRRLGAYLNEAVLPVLRAARDGRGRGRLRRPELAGRPGVQYLVISLAALAGTLATYELGVRRTPVTRVLFGLKPHSD